MSWRVAWAGSILLAAAAVGLAFAAIRRDAGLNVPPFIALIVAFGFLTGALALLGKAAGHRRVVAGLVTMLLGSFVLTGGWIALGPGERQCTGGPADDQRPVSGSTCRIVFGSGAALTTLLLVVAAREWRRQSRSGSR